MLNFSCKIRFVFTSLITRIENSIKFFFFCRFSGELNHVPSSRLSPKKDASIRKEASRVITRWDQGWQLFKIHVIKDLKTKLILHKKRRNFVLSKIKIVKILTIFFFFAFLRAKKALKMLDLTTLIRKKLNKKNIFHSNFC